MSQRLIVNFRGPLAQDAESATLYLDRARSTMKLAEAHGATLCAWSAWSLAFAFDPDELEEALTLASSVHTSRDGAPLALSAGIAEGQMSAVGERGSIAGLAWGLPLVAAGALARTAGAGELLVDGDLWARRGPEIEAHGFRALGDRIKRLVRVDPATPTRASDPGDRPSEPAPFVPEPVRGSSPSLRPPSDPVTEMAKRALLQGDVASLERLIADLAQTGEHGDLVERMSGFVALRRGATADALRRLRAASEAVKEPAQRARARLAYGVALASAGRTASALLEVLEALARAREAEDSRGEHACALFLARLSASAGHAEAASVWAMVASRAEAAAPS